MNLLIALTLMSGQAKDLALQTTVVAGASCKIVAANLGSDLFEVGVEVAGGFPGTDQEFLTMATRPRVVAAINGAYFDKATKKPIGDIWADGQMLSRGAMGTALCIGFDGSLDIQRVVRHKTMDWSAYKTVLACGPALMLDGQIDCRWKDEGFRDPSVTGATSRMGVGYTKDGRILFVYCETAVSFERFAAVMKGLGCFEAMNLDGGASLAMWLQGKTLLIPGRKLTNLLVIRRKQK